MNFLVYLLLFVTAFVPRVLAASKVDMTWDEGLYIAGGATAIQNVGRRDFSPRAWAFEFHPPVMMYFYGLAYAFYVFLTTLVDRRSFPDRNLLRQESVRLFKGNRALLAARLPSVVLGSLSSILVYLVCVDLFNNEPLGLVSGLILATTPGFVAWSSLAMLESGVTFFFTLTIWSLVRAVLLGSPVYLIVSGASLGLTIGSKETGLGVLSVAFPWLTSIAIKEFSVKGLSALVQMVQVAGLWSAIGGLVAYATWPWLWRNPLQHFFATIRGSRGMRSREGAGWGYYVTNLFMATPLLQVLLYALGTLQALYLFLMLPYLLLLFWVILPLGLMSSPFVPKRGATIEVLYLLPPLSILSSVAVDVVSKLAANAASTLLPNSLNQETAFLLLGSLVVGSLAIACIYAHPYYLNYSNLVGKANWHYRMGWWGEGMATAMTYVDRHAPVNSTVWIYGPRSTGFYHSLRVNMKESLVSTPLLHERAEAGFDVRLGDDSHSWREGDLQFYFPYYHPEKHVNFDLKQLASKNVSFVVIYRWATYNRAITAMDPGNYRIVLMFRRCFQPVFTSKVKSEEVCWVYNVGDLKSHS